MVIEPTTIPDSTLGLRGKNPSYSAVKSKYLNIVYKNVLLE